MRVIVITNQDRSVDVYSNLTKFCDRNKQYKESTLRYNFRKHGYYDKNGIRIERKTVI